jgi:hypothetical protein
MFEKENNMIFMWNSSIVFGLMGVSVENLKLGVENFVQKYVMQIPSGFVRNIFGNQ